MTRDQADRAIAYLAAAIRADWDQAGIVAALAKCHHRDLANVAMAALRAAVDPAARTPAVIPTNGPHWNEKLTDTAGTTAQRGPWCADCGQNQAAPIHAGNERDHAFTERTTAVTPETRAKYVAQARDRMAENPGPVVVSRAVTDERCGDGCIRGAGHQGDHLPPVESGEGEAA